jgi:hypothetical protein
VSGVNRLPCKIAYYMPDSRVRNYRDIFFNGSNKGKDLHKSLKLLLKECEKGLSLFLDLRLKSSNLEEYPRITLSGSTKRFSFF